MNKLFLIVNDELSINTSSSVLKNEYTDSDKFYQSHQVNHSTGTELPQQSAVTQGKSSLVNWIKNWFHIGPQVTNDTSLKEEKVDKVNNTKDNDKNVNYFSDPMSTKKDPSTMVKKIRLRPYGT